MEIHKGEVSSKRAVTNGSEIYAFELARYQQWRQK